MAIQPKLMTAEELMALPDDGLRRELVRGEVRTMPPARDPHGRAAASVASHMARFLYERPVAELRAAETGFLLSRDPDTVRAPDVAVVPIERLPPEGEAEGYFEGAPDLVVEVVSPGDTAADVQEKVVEWLAAGARLVWVVYLRGPSLVVHLPDRTSRTLAADDEIDGGEVLPGFRMRLRDLLHPFRRDRS
ncbi:MAG TPA: Uma2 family endonuclease [Chloroflexota bacterium]|jgi:Uma2 family endonuclease|nr:Uma2 family endonuclease [Chloroflexota bacterium]